MYALGSFLTTFAEILSMVITLYTYVIIGAVVISWVGADPANPIVRLLRQMTEPLFRQVRKLLPRVFFKTGLDFTPMIVLLLLIFINKFFVNLLYHYGTTLVIQR